MTNGKTSVGIRFGIRHFNQDWQFHFGYSLVFRQIRLKMRCKAFASRQISLASGFKDGSATATIRRKNLVSRASFRHVPDSMLEIRFGNAVIGFAVIRAYACARANQLINQPVVNRTPWNFLGETDDHFAKAGGSLFQIISEGRRRVVQGRFFSRCLQAPKRQFVSRTLLNFCHSIRHFTSHLWRRKPRGWCGSGF